LISKRSVIFCLIAIVALCTVGFITLMNSSITSSLTEVWQALLGVGKESAVRSVQQRRLPRFLTALLVGGCLGVAGAIFQSMSRNVLGSPDIIGFTSGAALGAICEIVFFGQGVWATSLAAIAGGFLTATLVYGLSLRNGISGGLRLILVGIGAGAVANAATSFVMVRADITDAATAQLWSAGSLTARGWPHVIPLALIVVLSAPLLTALSSRLTLLEMGDDSGASLGISPERTRIGAMIAGVALTGAGVAAAGPIAFIALAAPHIARRSTRSTGVNFPASFLTGAFLLACADLLSQSVNIALRTPVGLTTSLLGGVYLIAILLRRNP
jgi:iron complex transport system permease protein